MKNFLRYIVVTLFFTIVILEIVVRFFALSSHTLPNSIVNGDNLHKPYADDVYLRGGLAEIKGHYVINPQGFNSLKDYSKLPENKIKIAIIGDSYIEGLQVDVEKSIGRIIEEQMKDTVEVHEYGKSDANIVDYGLIYQKYVKGKYDYVFLWVTNKDLTQKVPGFMGRKDKIIKTNFARKIYQKAHFVRYLNMNHGIQSKVIDIVNKRFSPSSKNEYNISNEENFLKKINHDAISSLDESVVILYESEKLNPLFMSYFSFKEVEIIHKRLPKDFGFDLHWNLNGRINIAESIKKYINDNKK